MSDDSCCCSPDNKTGCLVCGAELIYSPDMSFNAECYYCGKTESTNVFCLEGHYVCNGCHRKDILELVEQICIESELTDPIELALCIYNIPTLHMHGPEYHSIVPAVLVSAYGNCIKNKDPSAIKAAISRGKAVFGGICGTHGACGAGIGVGVAYSVIHKVTPYSKKDRGEANRMTALALSAISRYGGPRCCKRDAITAIETAAKHFGCFENAGVSKYVCTQFLYNDMCLKKACPYYPADRTGV
ncbi:MAG: SAM-dependent methyltransferase [Clostridiales bacterium]|nr:SAM-dependent methyltransferase [Clostridiales bacterium]